MRVPKVSLPDNLADLDGLPAVDRSAGAPLILKRTLVGCTMATLDGLLVDPCLEEEDLCSASATVCFVSLQFGGGRDCEGQALAD